MRRSDFLRTVVKARPGAAAAPSVSIRVFNHQRDRRIVGTRLRQLVQAVLDEAGQGGELAVHLVSARRSAEFNQRYLNHDGPTDIITFDHGSTRSQLQGELFICVAEAVRQAVEFGTTWEEEIRRYVIHGLLHLRGFDDRTPEDRRRMKREENRLVRRLA